MKITDKIKAKYEEPVRGAAFIAWTALTIAIVALALVFGQIMGNHFLKADLTRISHAD